MTTMSVGVGVLLLGATVAIQVEKSRGVSTDEVLALLDALGKAVEARTGEPPVVSADTEAWACPKIADCVERLQAETGAEEILLVRVVGVSKRVRLVVERISGFKRQEIDLSRQRASWAPVVGGVVDALLPPPAPEAEAKLEPTASPPAGPAPPALAATATAAPAVTSSSVWPWFTAGGGVLAGAAAGVAYAVAAGEHDTYMTEFERTGERDEGLVDGANQLAGVAIGLGSAALVAGVVSAYGWLTEDGDDAVEVE